MFNVGKFLNELGFTLGVDDRRLFVPGFIMPDNGFRGFGRKPSGVAASKRAAAKRNNIRKHSR